MVRFSFPAIHGKTLIGDTPRKPRRSKYARSDKEFKKKYGTTPKKILSVLTPEEKDAIKRTGYYDDEGRLHFAGSPEDVELAHNAYEKLGEKLEEVQRKRPMMKEFRE